MFHSQTLDFDLHMPQIKLRRTAKKLAEPSTDAGAIRWGNGILLVSVIGGLLSVLFAYFLDAYIPMGAEIVAHIGVLFFAGTLKLGYVVRLNGQYLKQTALGVRLPQLD